MVEVIWWLIVAAYFGTAVLLSLCARPQKTNKEQRRVWWGLAGGMAVLGLNKWQNLTGILTNWGRQSAWQEGWYQGRAGLQLLVIALFLMVGVVFLVLLIHYRRTIDRRQWLAAAGVIFLFCFALVRAVSLHVIDAFLYTGVAGLQPNWLLELGGIALAAVPATVTLLRQPAA